MVGAYWCLPSKIMGHEREKLTSDRMGSSFWDSFSYAFCFTYSLGWLKKLIEAQLCYCCQILCSSLIVVITKQKGL